MCLVLMGPGVPVIREIYKKVEGLGGEEGGWKKLNCDVVPKFLRGDLHIFFPRRNLNLGGHLLITMPKKCLAGLSIRDF